MFPQEEINKIDEAIKKGELKIKFLSEDEYRKIEKREQDAKNRINRTSTNRLLRD